MLYNTTTYYKIQAATEILQILPKRYAGGATARARPGSASAAKNGTGSPVEAFFGGRPALPLPLRAPVFAERPLEGPRARFRGQAIPRHTLTRENAATARLCGLDNGCSEWRGGQGRDRRPHAERSREAVSTERARIAGEAFTLDALGATPA